MNEAVHVPVGDLLGHCGSEPVSVTVAYQHRPPRPATPTFNNPAAAPHAPTTNRGHAKVKVVAVYLYKGA